MKKVIQYNSIEQRDSIILEFSNLTLIEEQNITEGNFLVFSDNPSEDRNNIIFSNIPQNEFDIQKNKLAQQEQQIAELNLQDISMMEMLIERGLF